MLLKHSRSERIGLNPQSLSLGPELLVLPLQVSLHDRGDSNAQTCKGDLQDHSHCEARRISIRKEVRRVDIAKVSEDVDDSSGGSTLLGRLAESRHGPFVLQSVYGEASGGV
jgi:hypothetical protein